MKLFTEDWRKRHPKAAQWTWFALLWGGGVSAALLLAAPIKVLFYIIRTHS